MLVLIAKILTVSPVFAAFTHIKYGSELGVKAKQFVKTICYMTREQYSFEEKLITG